MAKAGDKTSGKKILVEQFRSGAGRTKEVKETLKALGLGGIGKQKELPENPAVLGMIKRVEHLVRIAQR